MSGERERERESSQAVRMNGVLKQTGVIRYLMQIALRESPMYEEHIFDYCRHWCSLTLVAVFAVDFANNQRKFRGGFLSEAFCLLASCIKQSVSALARI